MSRRWKDIIWIIASISIISIIAGGALRTSRNRINYLEHNWKVARDSLRVQELLNGQLIASRGSYILKEKEMEGMLEMKRGEIKELEKKLHSTLYQLSKAKGKIRIDTIKIPTNVYISEDSTLDISFKVDDEWFSLDGSTWIKYQEASTTINNLEVPLPLTIGLTKDHQFFVTSPNPYIHITDLTSTINEKSLRRSSPFGVGLQVGPGIYWNPINNKIDWGIGFQVGLCYKF